MRVLLGLVICYTFSFANFIEIYRLHGLEAVQKKFDAIMQTKNYWDGYLKDKDIRYGYYESINSVLVCNKSKKNLVLYKKIDNQFINNFSSSIFIGEKNGDKEKEGDLKTPIGVYTLIQKLTKLDPFYGPLALVTSYPNLYDKIKKKSGSGIWIHGLPIDKKRDEFTKGCVALENENIKQLNSKFNYKESIFLVNEKGLENLTKDNISNILSQIFSWKDAWEKSDIDKYLSFYNKNFKQEKNINFKKFAQRKTRIFKRSKSKTISFKNINISPYANNENKLLFKVIMDEDYKARYYKFKGKKELYLELKSNGKISILVES